MEEDLFKIESVAGKKAMALIRKADIAHPCDDEAIYRVFKTLPRDPSKRVLDVGSGLGGTANAIRSEGWGKVTGIDIVKAKVVYANETYPKCDFVHGDVVKADQLLEPDFDIVVSFNAFYQIENQGAALEALAKVAKHSATLSIYGFVDRGDYAGDPILENTEPLLPNPLHLDRVERLLADHGWRMFTIEPLHSDFADWYSALVEKIEAAEKKIKKRTSEGFFEHMLTLYTQVYQAFRENRLGGAIVRANHAKAG